MSKKKFEDLTTAGQRMRIAQDVIDQIKLKKYKAEVGNFFKLRKFTNSGDYELTNAFDKESPIEELLKDETVNCTVCALGAVFASCVNFTNEITYADTENGSLSFGDEVFKQKILEFFDDEQVRLIEVAFECGNGWFQYPAAESKAAEFSKARKFGNRYSNDSNRMVAIMKNIVEHRGKFVP